MINISGDECTGNFNYLIAPGTYYSDTRFNIHIFVSGIHSSVLAQSTRMCNLRLSLRKYTQFQKVKNIYLCNHNRIHHAWLSWTKLQWFHYFDKLWKCCIALNQIVTSIFHFVEYFHFYKHVLVQIEMQTVHMFNVMSIDFEQ